MIYDTLAGYYDALVSDPEAVEDWLEWMEPDLKEGTILELACGSGAITHALARKGWKLTALDLSAKMVEEARKKDPEGSITFLEGDMKNLEGLGMFDNVLCLCDSINYLSLDGELEQMLEQAAMHLKPGGKLFFDTHSLDRLEEFADEFNETGQFEDGVQVQWSIMSEDDAIYQDFAFYYPDGHMEQEHHLQRVFSPDLLEEVLNRWFVIDSVKTDFETPGIAPGEKYFYICTRKEEEE